MAKIERTTVRRRQVAGVIDVQKETAPAIQGRKPGEVKSLKGVLFGPPKTGKTALACSGRNVLLLEFDPQGDLTEPLQGRDDITVVTPSTMKEINSIIRSLKTTDAGRFDWVVVDSVTFLFQLLGGQEINKTYQDGKDVRRAYGKAGAAVQQIIHDLVMLSDTNVMFTAHLRKNKEEEGVVVDTKLGDSEVQVAVTPMVWSILGPAVSFIGRTFKETVWEKDGKVRNKRTRYAVSFNDGERSPAGSRLSMAGEYESTDSTLSDLYTELVKGS